MVVDGPDTWRATLVATSAAAPGVLLYSLAGEDRRPAGLGAAPFATAGLFVAHLATALPAGWALARVAPRAPSTVWVAAGLLAVGATAALGPAADAWLDAAGAGFLARALLRSALAVALVTPW